MQLEVVDIVVVGATQSWGRDRGCGDSSPLKGGKGVLRVTLPTPTLVFPYCCVSVSVCVLRARSLYWSKVVTPPLLAQQILPVWNRLEPSTSTVCHGVEGGPSLFFGVFRSELNSCRTSFLWLVHSLLFLSYRSTSFNTSRKRREPAGRRQPASVEPK